MRRYLPFLLIIICFSYNAHGNSNQIYADIARGYTDMVQMWLNNGGPVNMPDKQGNPPLLVAADAGHVDIVRLLIARGANLDSRNSHGYTPLFAAVTGRHPLVITELMSAGADASIENAYGTSIQEYVQARNYKDINEYTLSLLPAEARRGPISQMYIPLWERQADRFFNENKLDEGAATLKFAADQGDAYAQYRLGTFYKQSGHIDLAIDYLTRAADQKLLSAQNALGRYYSFEGKIKPAYASLGFDYTKQAADQGYAEAMLETGKAYLEGNGTDINYEQAAKYFEKANSYGLIDGRYYLGFQHYYGLGFSENKEFGLNEIYETAAQGSRVAQQQIKRFNTEAALDYIAGFTEDSPLPIIKTYMLSQGAVLTAGDGSKCDSYDVTRFLHRDYGIYKINICEKSASANSMSFNIYRLIKPDFKKYLDDYANKTTVQYIFDR